MHMHDQGQHAIASSRVCYFRAIIDTPPVLCKRSHHTVRGTAVCSRRDRIVRYRQLAAPSSFGARHPRLGSHTVRKEMMWNKPHELLHRHDPATGTGHTGHKIVVELHGTYLYLRKVFQKRVTMQMQCKLYDVFSGNKANNIVSSNTLLIDRLCFAACVNDDACFLLSHQHGKVKLSFARWWRLWRKFSKAPTVFSDSLNLLTILCILGFLGKHPAWRYRPL